MEMTLEQILDLTWVPILAFAMSFCAGIHMLLTKRRPTYLKSKGDNRLMRDERSYALTGGKLLLFFAAGAVVMCVLLFVNLWAALAEIVVVFLIFSIKWKENEEKNGPIGFA